MPACYFSGLFMIFASTDLLSILKFSQFNIAFNAVSTNISLNYKAFTLLIHISLINVCRIQLKKLVALPVSNLPNRVLCKSAKIDFRTLIAENFSAELGLNTEHDLIYKIS